MVEFNDDGSIKLPTPMIKRKQETENRLKKSKCMLIKKEKVSFTAPKKCMLHLRLSDAVLDNRFVDTKCDNVPMKIIKISEKEFDIEIGTHFKRCTDCNDLINRYREFLHVIEEKGNCDYEGYRNFSYEDYFE